MLFPLVLEEHYPLVLHAFNDLEVVKYFSSAKSALGLSDISELKAFLKWWETGPILEMYTNDDAFIGYTSLSDISSGDECEFSVFILDKNYWGKGIAKEATLLTLGHAFRDLGMKKVTLETSEFHENALRLYEKVGFKKVKVIPNDRTVFHNGEWILSGSIIMEIKSDDFLGSSL